MERVMTKATKKAFSKTLAALLAVLMVISPFSEALGELGWFSAWTSGDNGNDTVHNNTAYSNGEYSVLYDTIYVVGSGFAKYTDIGSKLAAALGISDATKVKTTDADKAGAGSLVVYACGTSEVADATEYAAPDAFKTALSAEVEAYKAKGADVLLVTPGPIVEYGVGMYYATHSGWTTEEIASGNNVTNLLRSYVEAISEVATEKNVGIVSLYGRAKLFGEEEYMAGTTDGIYPSKAGYTFMIRWIAEYIAENYVLSSEVVKSVNASKGKEVVIDLGSVQSDIDAVTITIPSGQKVPSTISVQTTKVADDQWFEAVADVKTENYTGGIYSASLIFDASQARYIRISADSDIPAGTTIKVHKTKLISPVLTYPVAGQSVTTKQAFNIEWSAVAGADRYEVTIINKEDNSIVKKFTTSDDVQTVPKGVLENNTNYEITVKAICSGYANSDAHSGTGSTGKFNASDDAKLALSSESIYEDVSEGKLITIGEQLLLPRVGTAVVDGNFVSKLIDDELATTASSSDTNLVNITALDKTADGKVDILISLGDNAREVSAVYFDTAFLAALNSINAKPDSVNVQYSTDGSTFTSAAYAMSAVASKRTLALGAGTAGMTRYIENVGATNVKAIKISIDLSDATESNTLYLDEIYVVGKATGTSGVISRDGEDLLASGLSGVNAFNGEYTNGLWLTHHAFSAVAPFGNAVPVELIVDLNKDANNNVISSGNHLVTGVDVGFAIDTNTICPSSIVISVQKEGESSWTTVGGKVYTTHGILSTVSYVNEIIPLTNQEATDVKAARVKITLYTNISNSNYPTDIASGTWGNWFALSHVKVSGGQYADTIEPDGATAAYHANYLQNTKLVGRDNFGNVNNTDIWNTISWKSAQYTTANSGYLEATGNITIGKVYWASQNKNTSASNKTNSQTPSATTPNVPTTDAKDMAAAVGDNLALIYDVTIRPKDDNSNNDYSSGFYICARVNDADGFSNKIEFHVSHVESQTKKIYKYGTNKETNITKSGTNYEYKVNTKNDFGAEKTGLYSVEIHVTDNDGAEVVFPGNKQMFVYVGSTASQKVIVFNKIEKSAAGYRVTLTVNHNNIDAVRLPTWTTANGQDDIKWHEAERVPGTANQWTCYIPVSEHNYESGDYVSHVYAYDYSFSYNKQYGDEEKTDRGVKYKSVCETVTIEDDTTAPTISNVEFTEITQWGYRVTCTATDTNGVESVKFPTWVSGQGQTGGQSTTIWYEGTRIGTDKWTCYVPTSNHSNYTGTKYTTHIYAYDVQNNAGKHGSGQEPSVQVPAGSRVADFTDITVRNYTATTFRIQGTITGVDAKIKSAIVTLWPVGYEEKKKTFSFTLTEPTDGTYKYSVGRNFNISNFDNIQGLYAFTITVTDVNNQTVTYHNGYLPPNDTTLPPAGFKDADVKTTPPYDKNIYVYVGSDATQYNVTNVTVTELSCSGYRVTCTVNNNDIVRVRFPSWIEDSSITKKTIWHEGEKVGENTWTCYIPVSDYLPVVDGEKDLTALTKYTNTYYQTHVYAYDAYGTRYKSNEKMDNADEVDGDSTNGYIKVPLEKPRLFNVNVSEVSSYGYRVTIDVSTNVGLLEVCFPTWVPDKKHTKHDNAAMIGQYQTGNNLAGYQWHSIQLSDDQKKPGTFTVTCYISAAEYDNFVGLYVTHVHARDLNADAYQNATGIDPRTVTGTRNAVIPGNAVPVNLAPLGTYAYNSHIAGVGVAKNPGEQYAVYGRDYEKPQYIDVTRNSRTIEEGGEGYRDTLNVYAKGKLNDGIFAKYANGSYPFYYTAWNTKSQTSKDVVITFDLGKSYLLTSASFKAPAYADAAEVNKYTVEYAFSADAKTWAKTIAGKWTKDGTIPLSQANDAPQTVYKNETTADVNANYRYVKITIKFPSATKTELNIDEIMIFGKSTNTSAATGKLGIPYITSHEDGDEVGAVVDLEWEKVTAPNGNLVTYSVTVTDTITDDRGITKEIVREIVLNEHTFTEEFFTHGPGKYTLTVYASADGYESTYDTVEVIYAPKYTITFHATGDGELRASGTIAKDIKFTFLKGTYWSDASVLAAVASVVAMPFTGADGNTYYFDKWLSIDGEDYPVPTEGLITRDTDFYASYGNTDKGGTSSDGNMTDGEIYDGTGNRDDYTFDFTNNNEAYDYVIIDLGAIYYSLADFDVSMYQVGNALPSRITFEVSSKLYVPSIAYGAAFGPEDWQYVSVVTSDDFVAGSNGRYHISDAARLAPIVDGAFGRYIKVSFWYNPDCGGVDVDEIMVTGTDEYVRANVADGKDAKYNGTNAPVLTDGAEVNPVSGTEFTVDLGEVKAGIHSLEIVGATAPATLYISAGGTSANDFHKVEAINGTNGIYKLSDKVSARHVRVTFDEAQSVSELRVFADAGRENYCASTGKSATLDLVTGAVELDNVVSIGAEVTIKGHYRNDGTADNKVITDGKDLGFANGVMLAEGNDKKLWYAHYTSTDGSTNLLNFRVITDWAPTLDSTSITAVIGTKNKTYSFEFNGDVDKGFVTSTGTAPYSYSAERYDDHWVVDFTVKYSDINGSNTLSDVDYTISALEGTHEQVSTGDKAIKIDLNGRTDGYSYDSVNSTWKTFRGYDDTDNEVIVELDLGKTYYGLNTFAITALDGAGHNYDAPVSVLFQVSNDGSEWKNVGFVQKSTAGDYHYYPQYQDGKSYAYNFNTQFEGVSARYVRAVLELAVGTKPRIAIQEFWVNAQTEPSKASGGDSAVAGFDYKMLWDDDNLYIAFQYEEDEVPFYTANHQYHETFSMVYDSQYYTTNGQASAATNEAGASKPNAFSISNLGYDPNTGYFQLDHDITKIGDANTVTSGYYKGYSTVRNNSFKLYKVGTINWNKGTSVTNGRFTYGQATETTVINTTTITESADNNSNPTIASGSVLNGYVLVSNGYALSQTIGGYSLTAKPITINGNSIPADQITDDLVWYFEDTASVSSTYMSDVAKQLGDYNVFSFYRDTVNSDLYDRYHFDNENGMAYYPYYLIRAYQGMVWENVYTYPRCGETPNIRVENTDGGNGYTPSDTNWNFDYNSSTGMWDIYLRGQGVLSYGNMYDNIDGASSMRIFLSAANMNDTARYDYGNYDIVIDAYVLDNNELILEDGTVLPLDSTLNSKYYHSNHKADYNTGWDGYKAVELKATALGMTPESNEYFVDFDKYTARAKFAQSENGQRLLTMEIAIPFEQLGFSIQKDADNKVTKWGNFYTKTGIERPIGKRTLMQFDYDFTYTEDHNTEEKENIDEFYYYVDASEFGYILQFAPEGKGYQDISYNKGEGYSTFSSVRGEVLNTTNGTEIEYAPGTFNISKVQVTRDSSAFTDIVNELKARDSFKYVEEDGMYYFTSQLDHERTFNQSGNISTELMIPAGGAYFSFDWKVSSETSDNLSFWLETTDTWNKDYKDWINTYNCGLPYQLYSTPTKGLQKEWTGVLDYSDTSLYSLYSEVLATKGTSSWKVNGIEYKNDACIATISGYKDITRNPEQFMLTGNKETTRSNLNGSVTVNVDNVVAFTPITDEENGMFKHVWDWHNVTVWIPNNSDKEISYTFTWMYYKNGTTVDSFSATDGRGTDDAQITNFHLSTTNELGYWKNTKNWDTLRLDATIADPSDTMLGVKDLAKAIVAAGEAIPAISATANDPKNAETNTFGDADFFTLSYAAIAAKDEETTHYFQTKNKISVSASNVPAGVIESYINNAIVFTQEYDDVITASSNLVDWTVLELKYNTSNNTWELTRMFEEGVDKSKFNIYADNNTIILAVNYTYLKKPIQEYGKTTEAIFFGYQNREVLKMLTPAYRYAMNEAGTKIVEEKADAKDVTQLITSNIFIRENYNIARGKMYSLRNNPTYSDGNYPYMENWFVENKGDLSLTDFLAAHSEKPLYYVNKNGEIANTDRTSSDYREAFTYVYRSYADYMANLGLHSRPMMFDTNQYGNVLYVPAGVGQLTDGKKMSVYSDTYLIQKLEDYAIGYYVSGTMGTPDADTVEAVDPADSVYSYTQEIDLKHDKYEVFQDVHTREENIILDLGTVEYGLSAFNIRFLGGGEDGVTFPTSVEFAISSDGLSYAYIGSVALDDTSFDAKVFDDEYAHASIVFSGATDTVYGNTVADYMFDLQTVGVTARYIKATIMNHSAQNAKTFITEFQVIQNAIYPDKLPATTPSTWIDASADANLMYIENLEMWDNAYKKPYSFALAPTTADYLFAEDEGYPDISKDDEGNSVIHNKVGVYKAGELTDGVGGSKLYNVAEGKAPVPTIDEIKKQSVGWMKAYAPEVSLTFDLGVDEDGKAKNIGFVSVYALHSKDSVDKIKQPFNVTAYVSDAADGEWLKVATVNAKDNDASEVTLKGMDVVIDVEGQNGEGAYTVYKYTLAFARDGELAQQISNKRYVKIVAETDGGEDGWICLTEVEVFEGHPCYPVYDLTESKYEKKALGAADDQDGDVRPTFFRGYYDSELYKDELPPYTDGAESGEYDAKLVFNNEKAENYTIGYVFGNVEQRAVDGRGVPYFYKGDQLLLRVTTDNLNCDGYKYNGDWVSNYKLLADSRIYYTSFGKDESGKDSPRTTRLFTTTAVTTPMTVTNVLARDRFTCEVPVGYQGEDSYYYLPIYLMNSLDYLKDYGYLNNYKSQNYINMPENKVELSGDLIWDTNYEEDNGDYADDKNGVSLNLAPLGAKTNTDRVQYNSKWYEEHTSLRFGSIWYIDDTAYYNTHTHMKQYGTLLMTIGNLGKYFTDSFAATSKYTSVFDDYGVQLTKSGSDYVSGEGKKYTDFITLGDGTDETVVYWGAKDTATLEMLKKVSSIVGTDTKDETKVMAALDVFLEYINNNSEGELVQNENYEDFGGIAMHSRANKYYYFSNISTKLVPATYPDEDMKDNPLYDYDSDKAEQNQTDLLGVYNYDQRYLEFDAIIAGIPESQKENKIVAVPYIIYANNYEFLEFGEHLGEGDEYVEKTWHKVFGKYYGDGNDARNTRFYVYGGGIARSIKDVLASQTDNKQYD